MFTDVSMYCGIMSVSVLLFLLVRTYGIWCENTISYKKPQGGPVKPPIDLYSFTGWNYTPPAYTPPPTGVILSYKATTADRFHQADHILPAILQAFVDAYVYLNVQYTVPENNILLYNDCLQQNFDGIAADITVEPYKRALALIKGGSFDQRFNGTVRIKGGMLFGPACTADWLTVAQTATSYMTITAAGAAILADTVSEFPFSYRCSYNMWTLWHSFLQFASIFSWQNFVILFDNTDNTASKYAESLYMFISKLNQEEAHFDVNVSSNYNKTYIMLEQIQPNGRIVILLLPPKHVRALMLEAAKQNMVDGEYIYFTLDIFADTLPTGGWNDPTDSQNDAVAKHAFHSVFIITLEVKTNNQLWKDLEARIKSSLTYQTYTGYTFPTLFTDPEKPLPTADQFNLTYYAAAFYDCIMYQALIYQQYRRNPANVISFDLTNGSQPDFQNKQELTYVSGYPGTFGMLGATGNMFIMLSGDRDEDFSFYCMNDRLDGTYQEVAKYQGYLGVLNLTGASILWPRANNTPPPSYPRCGFVGELCPRGTDWATIVPAIVIPVLALLAVAAWYESRRRMKEELLEDAWRANWSDLKIPDRDREKEKEHQKLQQMATTGAVKKGDEANGASMGGASMGASMGSTGMSMGDLKIKANAFWKNIPITYRVSRKAQLHITTIVRRQAKIALALEHENLLPFLGACFEKDHVMLIYEFANKGILRRIVTNENIKLDWTVRFSFLNDCAKGLSFIHSSPLKVHGRLTSLCCYIDAGFQLKIADYGMFAFFELNVAELWEARRDPDYRIAQVWKAPEHLVAESASQTRVIHPSSREGDIYSWGIIAQELILRKDPFAMYPNKDPGVIVEAVKNSLEKGSSPFKPIIEDTAVCTEELREIVKQCYDINPAKRPKLPDIRKTLREEGKKYGMLDHSNVLDTLLRQMEEQSAKLQAIVDENAHDILDEKMRCDHILYQILPKKIVETLKTGTRPSPESYELVTTSFFDILGFATMASESTPLQVIEFLNDLYAFFDESIRKFDAYKIESKNDVTLVVSGLPVLNGILHAREIGRLALTIVFKINNFKIKHRPDDQIRLRVGIHSGPLVAGVIGLIVPSFCLYGETINISLRMLQTGEALKIQISSMTKNILETFGSFRMAERGEIFVKGKGAMKTYWLNGEDGNIELLALQKKFEEDVQEDENIG